MKITDNISANLSAWMSENPNLDTIKKVSGRSNVGFGTVQRIKNGVGNPTINNLCDIAKVFGKKVEDLLAPSEYASSLTSSNVIPMGVSEGSPKSYTNVEQEILNLLDVTDERGKWELVGSARMLARMYPKQKNHSN